MEFKKINQLWNLADTLTVEQAAALIAGFDPGSVCFNTDGSAHFRDIETGLTDSTGISDAITAFAAVVNAINSGMLKATIRRNAHSQGWDEWPDDGEGVRAELDEKGEPIQFSGVIFTIEPAWDKTTVSRDDLVSWLRRRGFMSGFFFPEAQDAESPGYLDPQNPRYAPKLAAAVKAWQAVTDTGGKTPKRALEKWLREHAADFGMTDEDGNPVNTAIEEVAKVANWAPGGGAPKTPGG
ncbi:hypothetical protein ABZN20_10180 [Methylococcus sp. ANG]|uniref:hypothetical protein n=1 Tax=Methylococcus sp. ANG TaxID=3231903 RepID=UPI00345B3773